MTSRTIPTISAVVAAMRPGSGVKSFVISMRSPRGRTPTPVERRFVPAYHLALPYIGLGRMDEAFALLDQACNERDPALVNLAFEPRFEVLQTDPRFASLLSRLGL